jgi:hypothetical protein
MKHFTKIIAVFMMCLPLLDFYLARVYGQTIFQPFQWVLIIGAALSLLIRHKSAWAVGLFFMVAFVGSMVRERYWPVDPEADQQLSSAKFLGAMAGLYIIVVMMYFFRYPYLDRRQKWFAPTADRFAVIIPVLINGSIPADTTDLSYTGARINLKDQGGNFQKGDRLSLQIPEVADLVCQGEVIAKDDASLRVKFDKIDSDSREILRQWLLSQGVKKV